ncbi:hypothetical protein NDU88_007434 [Pleurodeles waltl]|uniref:Secreted protein n=1 Tax=Pleurodeles waltl TaxID=8319 RepID=A0AAV7P0U2_PLEWA|nr:hypothetical protein NDU88_007434 [Pleurodeles waltl]
MKRLLLVCRLGTRLEIGVNFTLNKITVLPTTSASLAYFIWRRARHQKSGASAAVLVLPSATPEERSERGRTGVA